MMNIEQILKTTWKRVQFACWTPLASVYTLHSSHTYNPMNYSSKLIYNSTQILNTGLEQLSTSPGRDFLYLLQCHRTAVLLKIYKSKAVVFFTYRHMVGRHLMSSMLLCPTTNSHLWIRIQAHCLLHWGQTYLWMSCPKKASRPRNRCVWVSALQCHQCLQWKSHRKAGIDWVQTEGPPTVRQGLLWRRRSWSQGWNWDGWFDLPRDWIEPCAALFHPDGSSITQSFHFLHDRKKNGHQNELHISHSLVEGLHTGKEIGVS